MPTRPMLRTMSLWLQGRQGMGAARSFAGRLTCQGTSQLFAPPWRAAADLAHAPHDSGVSQPAKSVHLSMAFLSLHCHGSTPGHT